MCKTKDKVHTNSILTKYVLFYQFYDLRRAHKRYVSGVQHFKGRSTATAHHMQSAADDGDTATDDVLLRLRRSETWRRAPERVILVFNTHRLCHAFGSNKI